MRAKLVAIYSQGCFCNRPALPEGLHVQFQPRFEFKTAVRRYCQLLPSAATPYFNRVDKSAIVNIGVQCDHRDRQDVRIGWELLWPKNGRR